jgi:hypothetical protein
MFQGVKRERTAGSESDDLQPYHQLVELQKQMMELVEQNADAERKCMALRQMVARDAEAMFLSRLGFRHRLKKSASKIFNQLLRRAKKGRQLGRSGSLRNSRGSRNGIASAGAGVLANGNSRASVREVNKI